MSLEALRELRQHGEKPSGVIKIVIGQRSPAVDEYADVIAVLPTDQPQHMDWRPVVGLPLVLLICDGASTLADKVLTAVMAAGGKPLGASWSDDSTSTDEAIRPTLRRMWRLLCT